MKKKILILGAVLTLVFMCACTKESVSSVDAGVKEEPIASVEPISDVSGGEETGEEKPDDTALYEAFVNGEMKASIDVKNNSAGYFPFKEIFDGTTEYSLDEISDALVSYVSKDWESVSATKGDVTNEYIDCGMDSVPELLIGVNINIGEYENFLIHFVVKNFDGSLKVCYSCESYARYESTVSPTGFVNGGGSAGAVSKYYECGYLNANVEYIPWYSCSFEMGLYDTQCYLPGLEGSIDLSAIEEDLSKLYVDSYTFDTGAEKPEYFYTYYFVDDDYNIVKDDSIYDLENPIRKAFLEKELTVVPEAQIQNMLDKRQAEIGLSDLVIQK